MTTLSMADLEVDNRDADTTELHASGITVVLTRADLVALIRNMDDNAQGAAVEAKLSGTPCPRCGRIDWLAGDRLDNGQIAAHCDECGYGVRVSL